MAIRPAILFHLPKCCSKTNLCIESLSKITENRLNWYGHVMRREEEHVVRRVMTKEIPGKRKRGRPKTRWEDLCRRDMQTVGLRAGEQGDRAYWRARTYNHTGGLR